VWFYAKYAQGHRLAMRGDDAVLRDNAVLLSARDNLAGKEKQWPVGVVDERKLIDLWAASGKWRRDENGVFPPDAVVHGGARAHQTTGLAGLRDHDFAGANSFIESQKESGVKRGGRDDRENG
jgi:hypothetical protein